MNYRHIYHAGNICDVVKHSILATLLRHLLAKDKPFTVLDTHAGTGCYNLQDERATKTNEAASGILKFLEAAPIEGLEAYYGLLRKLNPDNIWQQYPGSPLIVRHMLRAQDELIACELHPEDANELRRRFYHDPQVHVHQRDGYEALMALFPPASKRGLVLIDPPYEQPDEFDRLTQNLVAAHKRWNAGQFAVWYPIKERPTIWRWHEALVASGMRKILCAEFIFEREVRSDRLNGTGMIIVNPPWQFEEELKRLFPALHQALGTPHQGGSINWLVGE